LQVTETDVYDMVMRDLSGRTIATLVNNERIDSGRFTYEAMIGQDTPAGIYLIEIQNSKGSVFKKMIIQ